AVNRPGWSVPAEITMDHPYDGLVATWVDRAPDVSLEAVVDWVLGSWAPAVLTAQATLAQALVFTPRDFPGVPGTGVGVGEKVLVAWLAHDDPRAHWDAIERALHAPLAEATVATLGLLAPFVPVVPGTDTYLDELW
ncbi:MAG: hypothetical protein ACKOA9_08370, partial [Actinomycetota bacterium]